MYLAMNYKVTDLLCFPANVCIDKMLTIDKNFENLTY